ncbi:UPF0187-domain-containing protein [Saccharata proteae CBS 121410]|uniref:UPF0187-domain-containing protein n=1 Tax=Saccharata proteae CBS 121410 TaxID=1314787 RepID=A0A6A5YE35_9PEZI|nr:UPF0187-domain-containing protein [Saccharata proteae CBS 121410]
MCCCLVSRECLRQESSLLSAVAARGFPNRDGPPRMPRPHTTGGQPQEHELLSLEIKQPLESIMSPPDVAMPHYRARKRHHTPELDEYFVGPRAMDKHSKLPVFMRMHGSILPEMILPLLFVAAWSTLISCISKFVYSLGVSNILLTVLGFVVSLAISFRSSTAYERYSEGRKYWAQLMLVSQTLAREIWISAEEPEGDEAKEVVLGKLTGLNLIVAFATALKHKLRFEPYAHYEDLQGLVQHLDTYAKEAEDPDLLIEKRKSSWKRAGEYLGVPMAESNPRKQLKRSKKPLGNLPLEILSHLSAYVDSLVETGALKNFHVVQATQSVTSMNEVLQGVDRVLNTPLPIAYAIAISQITWVYILLLPFQLWSELGWVTIPAAIAAAYIILGFEVIGREIENPFGHDVNDLPLDDYCNQLAAEIDIIASRPRPRTEEFIKRADNKVLFPFSSSGYGAWASRSVEQIRERLQSRPYQTMQETEDARKSLHQPRHGGKEQV